MRAAGDPVRLLTRAACAPASLDLKAALRRAATAGGDIVITGSVDAAGAAWIYWLLDGAALETGERGGELLLVSRRWPRVTGRIVSGIAQSSGISIAGLPCGKVSARLDAEGTVRIAVELFDDLLPLVFPEGDGLFYSDLEVREEGVRRILPVRVIDEALEFADAWR